MASLAFNGSCHFYPEDDKSGLAVSLLPLAVVSVELEGLDSPEAELEPVDVDDVLLGLLVDVAEDLERLVVTAEVEADALGPALLVAGPHGGEDGVVRLALFVRLGYGGRGQRVDHVGGKVARVEELAGPVAQQLVKADLELKGRYPDLLQQHVVVHAEESCLLGRLVARRDHVAQIHVLEALGLPDLIVCI